MTPERLDEPCKVTGGAFCLTHWSRTEPRALTCDLSQALAEINRLRAGIEAELRVHRGMERSFGGPSRPADVLEALLNPTEGEANGIEAEDDSRAARLMSSRDDALRRAENAERERDEAYAAREHFSGHIDYWTEQTDEARHRAADAEDDRDAWKQRYTDLLDRIRGRRNIYALPDQAPIFRAETVASELAALLPDEEDDR